MNKWNSINAILTAIFCFAGILIFSLISSSSSSAQELTGVIFNKNTNKPIEYVNVGIVGKGIGTVSCNDGKYSLFVDWQYDNDTIMISCIGYKPFSMRLGEFKQLKNYSIYLEERIYVLADVVVRPRKFKQKVLGNTTKSQAVQAGFKENQLGYECGIYAQVKKSAKLEKVNINISRCTYDSIFYRCNIYEVKGKWNFENILIKPIYISFAKDEVKETLSIDLTPYNLWVNGDFIVTLEHIMDLGPGFLYFSAGLAGKTYYRKTSQGKWETAPVGIGISVLANVEQ
jgi:hypothetical protein